MAHSYVSSFSGLEEITDRQMIGPDGKAHNFLELVLQYRHQLGYVHTNEGELAAFISYAQAFLKVSWPLLTHTTRWNPACRTSSASLWH